MFHFFQLSGNMPSLIQFLDKIYSSFTTAESHVFNILMDISSYPCALAITDAIRGSSREKLYQELGLEALQQRRWYRKLCCFYKMLKSQSPKYLYSIIPIRNMSYRTRQCNKIPAINVKHDFFKNTFFLQQ